MKEHWDDAYARKGEAGVSWFQDSPEPSLALMAGLALAPDDPIIDVGGGASRLVDNLLAAGHRDVTVLDLSAQALAAARTRLGPLADKASWVEADVTTWAPPRRYALWHDRAVFHFMVDPSARAAYLATMAAALRPGGRAIIATFAPDGPERCSGLPVQRYDAPGLADVLGPGYALIDAVRHVHVTPWGSQQAFQFAVFARTG